MSKNKFVALIICLCLLLFQTGCAGKKAPEINNPETPVSVPSDAPSNTSSDAPSVVPSDAPSPEPTDIPVATPEAEPTDIPAGESEPDPLQPEKVEAVPIGIYPEYDFRYDDRWNVKATEGYDLPVLPDYYSSIYPELAAALYKYAVEEQASMANTLDLLEETYDDLLAAGDEYGIHDLKASEQIVVQRADTRLVSFNNSFSHYTGGVHGYYGVTGFNFNTETGKELVIGDIVTDTEAFASIAASQLVAEKEEEIMFDLFGYDLENYINTLIAEDRLNFTVSNYGVTVSFNPYEIGSFAAGIISTTVFFSTNPELFFEKYLETSDSYMLNFPDSLSMENDYDFDGKIETISIYGDNIDEFGDYYGIIVNVNYSDDVCKIDENGYYLDAFLMQTDHGTFLYIESMSGGDVNTTYICKLQDDKATYLGAYSMSHEYILIEDTPDGIENFATVLFDPKNMIMSGRCDMIGTNFVKAHFEVGPDGFPALSDEYYSFSTPYLLTSKVDLELPGISTETFMPGETITVPAGSIYRMLYTDCESFVIFELEDYSGVIMELDPENNYGHYKDLLMDDIFDGILYAG